MTVEELLSRMSSKELTDHMAYDLLGAEGDQPPERPAQLATSTPLPAGSARRIRLDDAAVLDKLDRYWPPEP